MEALLHQVLSGLATGGIYASLALALVMIYRSTNHINFAQGEMAMFSTYLAWTLVDAGVSWWLAFLITVAASFVAGMAIENARLAERAETRRKWGQAATEMGTALLSGADPDDVLRAVSTQVSALTNADMARVLAPASTTTVP